MASQADPAAFATAAPPRQADMWWRLARIDLTHEYDDGPSSALALAPTPRTRSRLQRFGLQLRARRDGYDILTTDRHADAFRRVMDAERTERAALSPSARDHYFGPPLLFELTARDPDFLLYSDVPGGFGGGARALWLGNDGRLPGRIASADWAALGFTRPAPPPAVVPAEPRRRGRPKIPFRPSFLGKGGFHSMTDIREGRREFGAYRSGLHPLPLILFDLHLTRDSARGAPGDYPIALDPAARVDPVAYTLRFAARATRWRYFVTPRERPLGEIAIVDAAGADAGFRPSGPSPRAPETRCLVAEGTRRLHRRAASGLSLVSIEGAPGRSRRRTLIDPLPTPRPEALSLEGGEVYSDIHLFV